MHLIKGAARAYVYSGEWVADCPRQGCGNVEYLWLPVVKNGPRIQPKPFYMCSNCGMQADIDWPSKDFMIEVIEVLMKRPIPANRNWYPAGHDVAVVFRIPHGQTISELREENHEHGVEV